MTAYADYQPLTFHDAARRFTDGNDSPRAYLERCLETIAAREPVVKAFTAMNEAGARAAADASAARWKAGKPLSLIDGMPIAIKDLLETKDMPTEMGCEAMKGNFPKRDNAAVWALRQAGAVILAKTVTAELGGSHPGATTNPFDPTRTPGGSSSGSAAAVGANMVPAAIGTQVGGSIIRPAAYCGNFALKPTQGGINRGERLATSMSTHGPHANCLEDMWQVAIEIAKRCGGDRGALGLMGPDTLPAAIKPNRLIVLETEGWPDVDAATKAGFAEAAGPAQGGRRHADPSRRPSVRRGAGEGDRQRARDLQRHHAAGRTAGTSAACSTPRPDGLSERAKAGAAQGRGDDARPVPHQPARPSGGAGHATPPSPRSPTPRSPSPAPARRRSGRATSRASRWRRGRPATSCSMRRRSMLFAPVVTVPLMSVGGMPVGVQLMGQQHEDARMTGIARWMTGTIKRVSS